MRFTRWGNSASAWSAPSPIGSLTSMSSGVTTGRSLPEAAEVELAVYDILGQKVQTLVAHELQGAGYYRLTWDGRNYAGRSVASGLYFYRLAMPEFVQTRKMTLIK